MEKKTFNDMMANLPTTETDMTRVMVEMEDGRKGWISAEGLAQVMAGLMPVATAEKQGVMSSAMAQKTLPLLIKNAQNNTKWLKIVFSSGYNALVGLDGNNQFGTLIGVTKRTWNDAKAKLYVIYGYPSQYEYKTEDDTLYIKLSSWNCASILIFTGSVVSEDFVENPPESAESILTE